MLISLFIINACSTTTVPGHFDLERHTNTSLATVYIYRPNAMANVMVTPEVMIDGSKVFSINNNYYHVLQLPEGKHRLSLNLAERYQGINEISLETLVGQNYFVRVSTAVKFQKNKPYDRWFNLEQVSAQVAEAEIVLCKPYVSKEMEVVGETSKQDATDAEYSSQKFRNPFSK